MVVNAEAYGPFTEYMQKLGLGGGYQNPAQTYLANLYNPIRSLWEQAQPIRAAAGTPGMATATWPDYIFNTFVGREGKMGILQNQSADILNQLLGYSPETRQTWGLNYEPTHNPLTGAQEWEGKNLGDLQDLMTLGLRGRFGPQGAGWAAGRLPYFQQEWQLGQAGGGQKQTFLDYIKAKYGL